MEDVELGDDPGRTYRATIRPFLEAWQQPGALERTVRTMDEQSVPAEVPLRAHWREILVHGWDLATAIGRSAPFDDAGVEACLQSITGTPAIRPSGIGYANAVPAPDHAPPIVRLAAFYGRDITAWPAPDASS